MTQRQSGLRRPTKSITQRLDHFGDLWGQGGSMAYNKHQAADEFARWSESYDRCILQWLLFGPSHRAIIRRIRTVAGDRPVKILDVGCGTGVFATRIRAALSGA